MTTRRAFLACLSAFAAVGTARAAIVGADLTPATGDRSEAFRAGLARAAAEKRPFVLAPGTYQIGAIELPDGAQIHGIAGLTTLVLAAPGALIAARNARRIVLSGLAFDGRDLPVGGSEGLLAFADVTDLRLVDCIVGRANQIGVLLDRCGGRIEKCTVGAIGSYGIFARDSRALTIADNTVADCGDGGILVHRAKPGEDGTVVSGNRVERIRAKSGGTGQVGNGINVFKADDVVLSGNRIVDCAFSGIRANSASNIRITGNEILRSGETGLYVEFAFTGAVVSGNIVDGASNGISIVNFMQGGRLATISANVVRNLRSATPYQGDKPVDDVGFGIVVEADAAITGNVVENAPLAGILAGWGNYLRNVTITGNVVRACGLGVAVSVVENAGAVVIVGNAFQGLKGGAVVGHRWAKAATGDLTRPGAEIPAHLTVADNRVAP